ncbi:hypothetical protein OFN30_12260, partial [Escherichia coli]|nr:hypothetical protein [Escherichia coli]
ADRNRSHWSTSKTPSYTKSVSWQHHQKRENKRLTYRTVKNATILRFENDDTITVGAFINDRV